jgi:hypothetical protein
MFCIGRTFYQRGKYRKPGIERFYHVMTRVQKNTVLSDGHSGAYCSCRVPASRSSATAVNNTNPKCIDSSGHDANVPVSEGIITSPIKKVKQKEGQTKRAIKQE